MKYNFILPCAARHGIAKPKRIPYNLNWYRNAHFRLLSQIKKDFEPLFAEPFKADQIKIYYELRLTKHRTDVMNWVSVVDKFFCDWLTAKGMIPDDDSDHVIGYEIIRSYHDLPDHELSAIVEVIKER